MLAYETQSYLHGRIREHLRWTVFSFWAEFSQSNKSTDTRDNANVLSHISVEYSEQRAVWTVEHV